MTTSGPISEDDLHAYIDKVLDTNRQAEVEAYLEANPDVAQRIRAFARQRTMLREAFAPIAQQPVPAELRLGRFIEARRTPALPTRGWAVAALVLLAIGGAGGWFGHSAFHSPTHGIAALALEASDSFEVYGSDHIRPVEIKAASSVELVSWFSQRLKHPVLAPDLGASGYRFMGGRLVATPHGPAGMFMYDDDHGTRLVMLVRPMAIEKDTSMSQRRDGRVSSFTWAQRGIGYSLVGATAPEILHPLADEIRRQTAKLA